jgi:hypothetical protein
MPVSIEVPHKVPSSSPARLLAGFWVGEVKVAQNAGSLNPHASVPVGSVVEVVDVEVGVVVLVVEVLVLVVVVLGVVVVVVLTELAQVSVPAEGPVWVRVRSAPSAQFTFIASPAFSSIAPAWFFDPDGCDAYAPPAISTSPTRAPTPSDTGQRFNFMVPLSGDSTAVWGVLPASPVRATTTGGNLEFGGQVTGGHCPPPALASAA